MNLINQLIDVRILLASVCDGFENNGKSASLSARLKILFLLEKGDCSPNELITKLCVAKSNIANMLKAMISENLVESYRESNNSKNVYYKITDRGQIKLNNYKNKLVDEIKDRIDHESELSQHLLSIINILKGNKHD